MRIGERKGKVVIKKVPVRPGEVVPVIAPQPIKVPERVPAIPAKVPEKVKGA